MWTIILNAIIKEIETNPDRFFSLLEKIVDLFSKHPEAVTAAISMIKEKG